MKYDALLKPIEEEVKGVLCYLEILEKNSAFDAIEICSAIAKAMSVYEGVKYISQLVYDSNMQIIPCVIPSASSFNLNDENLDKNENILVFPISAITGDYLTFYHCDGYMLSSTVEFGRFTYVQEFVDYAISRKVETKERNNFEDLVKEFISSKMEEILKYQQAKEEKIEQEMASRREYRKALIDKICK